MTDLERVKQVVNWLIYRGYGVNERDIAEQLGYTKSSFSQIMNGKVPLSKRFIERLCKYQENINKDWILVGQGEMLLSPIDSGTSINIDEELDSIIKSQLHYIRFYPASILYHLRYANEYTGGKKFDRKQFEKEEQYAEQYKVGFEEPFYKKFSTKEKLEFINELNEATRVYLDNIFVLSRDINHNTYEGKEDE